MASSDRPKFEYESVEELTEDYKKLVISNPNNFNVATEYMFDSLLEEAAMGIVFQMHFESKYPVSLKKFSFKSLSKI